MTTQQLIETYQLNFFNAVEQIANNPQKIGKRVSTFNKFLTDYLSEWRTVSDINVDLLPDIQYILNEEAGDFDDSSHSTIIIANNVETKIYDNNNSSVPDVIISTQDFHDILVLWRDFLNEPPLNGTLVDGVPSV